MQYSGIFIYIIVCSVLGVAGTFSLVYLVEVLNIKFNRWLDKKIKDGRNDG